jgi:hypothetical protein
MKKMLIALVSVLALTSQVSAETSESDVKRLREIQQNIVVLERLDKPGHGLASVIEEQFEEVRRITGEEITTRDQLSNYLLHHDKTGGFFTFLNIVWFFASLIVIIALSWLCFVYMGANAIEFLGYVLCALGLASGLIFPSLGIWFVVPACLLLFALLMLTENLHFKEHRGIGLGKRRSSSYGDEGDHQLKPGTGWLSFSLWQVQFAILTIVYGGAALAYNSQVLGFMTIMALEGLLGFTVLVGPLCICTGFQSDKVIPRATAASFMILAVYLLTRISGGDPGMFHVFQTGAFFIGTFVYFLGLLILSSWYYYAWSYRDNRERTPAQFWLMQVVTIASGCAALYVGSVFGIGTLLGVGGTFFVIYLMEKYTELPWSEIGFAWGLLGAGLLLFGAAWFAYHHPQYFFLGVG